MTSVRELSPDDRARLAARLIDEVGLPAVERHRDGVALLSPEPGRCLLACRCGAVLDAADMRRAQPTGPTLPGCLTVRPIVCAGCAS